MAAYAVTVVVATTPVERIFKRATRLYIAGGTCNITNYNSTRAEITGITGLFGTLYTVVCNGVTDEGYLCYWHVADKAFKCMYPRAAQTADTTGRLTIVASGAAHITDAQAVTVNAAFRSAVDAVCASELASDVDAGLVHWIAIGSS